MTLTVGRAVRVVVTVAGLAALGLGLADTAHAAEINPRASDDDPADGHRGYLGADDDRSDDNDHRALGGL